MFTKYEQLKISATILGESISDACDEDIYTLRRACMAPSNRPDVIKKIDAVIERAEKKFSIYLKNKSKSPSY